MPDRPAPGAAVRAAALGALAGALVALAWWWRDAPGRCADTVGGVAAACAARAPLYGYLLIGVVVGSVLGLATDVIRRRVRWTR